MTYLYPGVPPGETINIIAPEFNIGDKVILKADPWAGPHIVEESFWSQKNQEFVYLVACGYRTFGDLQKWEAPTPPPTVEETLQMEIDTLTSSVEEVQRELAASEEELHYTLNANKKLSDEIRRLNVGMENLREIVITQGRSLSRFVLITGVGYDPKEGTIVIPFEEGRGLLPYYYQLPEAE